MKRHTFLLLAMILFIGKSFSQNNTYTAKLSHKLLPGIADSVYEGYYEVYENRIAKKGKKIRLYIIVIPSINKTNEPPIFCTEGGPGVAVSNGLSFYADKNNIYRQNNDVVLIDARGTGKSNPLHCPALEEKENLSNQFDEMYPVDAVKECYQLLSKENDLMQYNTTNVVKDLEEVRKWLGYKKIHLYGLSYGTRVVLQYMRMYPSSIRSAVLWSPTTTYERMPLHHAKFAQLALNFIWKDCKKDSACVIAFPNIKNEFEELMKHWKEKPLNYNWNDSLGNTKAIAISWDAFQTKIRSLMYAPASIRKIPFIIHEAWRGNLQPFIDLYPKKKNVNNFIAEGFYLCVTCTEDVPFIKESAIKSQTDNTFMGTYRIKQQQQACAHWTKGNLLKDFLLPVKSSIPTLLLSGFFDPVTPTLLANEIASHLSKSKLIIIPNMSHVFDGLSNENCFDEMVMEFIRNPNKKDIDTKCVKFMLPPPYKIAN